MKPFCYRRTDRFCKPLDGTTTSETGLVRDQPASETVTDIFGNKFLNFDRDYERKDIYNNVGISAPSDPKTRILNTVYEFKFEIEDFERNSIKNLACAAPKNENREPGDPCSVFTPNAGDWDRRTVVQIITDQGDLVCLEPTENQTIGTLFTLYIPRDYIPRLVNNKPKPQDCNYPPNPFLPGPPFDVSDFEFGIENGDIIVAEHDSGLMFEPEVNTELTIV